MLVFSDRELSMIKRMRNRNIIFLITAFILIGVLSGCSSVTTENDEESSTVLEKASFTNITPKEAKKMLDSEKGNILLDVRTKEEYTSGHIKNSILIPVDDLNKEAGVKLKDKESNIIVYCRSGNRSATAAKILVNLGYKNVYDLGGINNWPYEVVK